MYLPFLVTLLSFVNSVSGKIIYAGVNESGGEFNSSVLPGRFGVDFAFINKSTVDIFVDQEKINFFRVPFLMERMCPLSYGLGRQFNETYFAEYADAIHYITKMKGAYALIDPHNYMRYNDPSQQPFSGSVIGNTSDPTAATTKDFEAFWHELAHRFVKNPKVVFGINNEPHDMPTELVLHNDQAAINGIRSAGARQLILAPGNGFTGGDSWTRPTGTAKNWQPSSDFVNKLVDPLLNTAIDVHEYLDIDFSGSHDACTQPGPSSLASLTTWLQENNLKFVVLSIYLRPLNSLFEGPSSANLEGGNNQNYFQFIDDLLNYLATNDEYIGWSIWAAGPIWGTHSPCCGPDTGSLEPGQVNDLGGPNAFDTVWAQAVRPNIPQNLKRSGISSIS